MGDNNLFKKIKFVINGGITTLIHIVILFSLSNLGMNSFIASSIGYVFAVIYSYITSYFIVFKSNEVHLKAFSKFITISLTGFLVNLFIIYIVESIYHLSNMISMLLIVIIIPTMSYILNNNWTFILKDISRE
jgi:putative flippase GtrA